MIGGERKTRRHAHRQTMEICILLKRINKTWCTCNDALITRFGMVYLAMRHHRHSKCVSKWVSKRANKLFVNLHAFKKYYYAVYFEPCHQFADSRFLPFNSSMVKVWNRTIAPTINLACVCTFMLPFLLHLLWHWLNVCSMSEPSVC